MSPRITNNRLFIDTPNHQDVKGMNILSVHSHRVRQILGVIFRIFCCCLRRRVDISVENNITFSQSFFSFETFKVNVEEKAIFLKKKDYLKWKSSTSLGYYENHFSKDFHHIIQSLKIQPVTISIEKVPQAHKIQPVIVPIEKSPSQVENVKNSVSVIPTSSQEKESIAAPSNLNPIENKLPPPDSIPVTPIPKIQPIPVEQPMDARGLVEFFNIHKFAPNAKWESVLSTIDRETFEEAIRLYGNNIDESKVFFHLNLMQFIKQIYPLANENQKEILLNTLGYPEWILVCFPDDQILLARVSHKISLDFNKRQQFFKKLINGDIDTEKTQHLAKSLIKKFIENPQYIKEEAKKNPFGLDLKIASGSFDTDWVINFLLKDVPFENVMPIFTALVHHPDFQTGFALKLFSHLFKTFDHENQQNILSDKTINFSLAFLDELNSAHKCENFLQKLLSYNDELVNGPFSPAMKTFINSCIIGILRYRPEKAEKILRFLVNNSLLMLMLNPKITRSNPTLEANLSIEEKKLYLKCAENIYQLKDANFQNTN